MMYWISLTIIVFIANLQNLEACVGFWAGENYPFDEDDYWNERNTSIYTEQLWSLFAEKKVRINLNLRYKRDFGPVPAGKKYFTDGLDIVKKANAKQIPIGAWLVVPMSDGYWAHEGNPDVIKSAVEAFLTWTNEHKLKFEELVIDCECSYQDIRLLQQIVDFKNMSWQDMLTKLKLFTWFIDRINPKSQCESTKKYKEVLTLIKQSGMEVSAGALPLALPDLQDSNVALHDGLNMSTAALFTDMLKVVYNMAYRSESKAFSGVDPGPDWIKHFYKAGKEKMGSNTEVTLGVGGYSPYDELKKLIYDIRLLVKLGAKYCPIYSLETTMSKFDLTQLREIVEAGENPLEKESSDFGSSVATFVTNIFFSIMDVTATVQTWLKLKEPNRYPGTCFEN